MFRICLVLTLRFNSLFLLFIYENVSGVNSLSILEELTVEVINKQVPGDFVDVGVWRGGSCHVIINYSIKIECQRSKGQIVLN